MSDSSPLIHNIKPTRGEVGTKVFIYGDNLDNSHIFFGTTAAKIIATEPRQLTVEVPDGYGRHMIKAENSFGTHVSSEPFTTIFTFRGDAI